MSGSYAPGPSKKHRDGNDSNDHEEDSGYGSVYAGSSNEPPEEVSDIFNIPVDAMSHDRQLFGSSHRRSPSMATQRQAVTHLTQLKYNNNRIILGRCIDKVVDILKELQRMNKGWPIYYPGKDVDNDIASTTSATSTTSPRLLTRSFQVFKLDLKFGSQTSEELVHSLEKASVASLLEGKIIQTVKHLSSLRERIDDTASKVLVTGDLNAGKSTFCNALLRRKVLPEDQQPCTSVFCEVIDYKENNGIEEVHAVHIGRTYDRRDGGTYDIFSLDDLDHLVGEHEKYSLLKVFVDEKRPVHRSLLRNGIVDISLIDAPGLNLDSYQTTQLFARQEEIDLVVFVVSAENHFTLSAKEFISNAAHEKSFIFIVVNRFDNIKDKSRCMRRILGQVADLSPETHKDAREFVHFVSSNHVRNDDGDDGGDGGGGDDDGPDANDADFDRLEESLRNFVLEKRSLSKLAPAKTYLNNILLDLEILSEVNMNFTKSERNKYQRQLEEMEPQFEKALSNSVKVTEQVDRDIEELSQELYDYTTQWLTKVLNEHGAPSVKYTSIFDAYKYASDIRAAIVQRIHDAVSGCEEHARSRTVSAVNSIKSLGILHLGDQPAFMKVFKHEAMFSRKRDSLARSIRADLSIVDFVAIPSVSFIPTFNLFGESGGTTEKSLESSTVNNALTIASVVGGGQMVLRSAWLRAALQTAGWVDYHTAKRLLLPLILLAGVCGVGYVVSEIPNSVQRNVAKKVAREVSQLGYVHANADRISKECRKVLKYPAQDMRAGFQSNIEKQLHQKEDYSKSSEKAEECYCYFSKLHKEAAEERARVGDCNLEGT
jgi:mitofusin